MYRRIAVPVDGSLESRRAIGVAVSIARKANCPIDFVHVGYQPIYAAEMYGEGVSNAVQIKTLERNAQRELQAVVDETEALGIQATATVLDGDISTGLVD